MVVSATGGKASRISNEAGIIVATIVTAAIITPSGDICTIVATARMAEDYSQCSYRPNQDKNGYDKKRPTIAAE